MPPFACLWSEEGDSVPNEDETRVQEAQLTDWLGRGEAFSAKSPDTTEEAVILKVFPEAQPEAVSDLHLQLHTAAC